MHYGAYVVNDPAGKIYYIIVLFRNPCVCVRIGEREIHVFDDIGYIQRNSLKQYKRKEKSYFKVNHWTTLRQLQNSKLFESSLSIRY